MELEIEKNNLFHLSLSEEEASKQYEEMHLPHVIEILDKYIKVLKLYEDGVITKGMRDRETERIYNNSGYNNLFDFLYDLGRRQCGLPIYIKIKLIWKEDKHDNIHNY